MFLMATKDSHSAPTATPAIFVRNIASYLRLVFEFIGKRKKKERETDQRERVEYYLKIW